MDVSSHEDSAGEFYCTGSIFVSELVVRIYSLRSVNTERQRTIYSFIV